jgi:hypothetical protein
MAEAAAAAARGEYEAALSIWIVYAHAGVARAQAEIGRCFLRGWGVSPSVDQALKWLTLAAEAGDPLGKCLLARICLDAELPQSPALSLNRLN